MNLIRCELPDGEIRRYPMINVEKYRDLLMIRADIESHDIEKQKIIIQEVLDEFAPNTPKNYQPYVFCSIYLYSLGNTFIPLVVTCPKCGKEIKINANFVPEAPKDIVVNTKYGISLTLKFPEDTENIVESIQNGIKYVKDSEKTHDWITLTPEEQIAVISTIDLDVMEEIIKKSNPINKEIHISHCGESLDIYVNDMLTMFKLFMHKDELMNFYNINHRMVTMNYDNSSIMNMIPMERTVALALIEHDIKKAQNK